MQRLEKQGLIIDYVMGKAAGDYERFIGIERSD